MGKTKPGYTLEQHDQLGIEIQTIRDRLVDINTELTRHYPIKTKPIGHLKKIQNLLEKFRSEMEELAFKEHKTKTEKDITQLYYRATRADHIRNPQPIRPVE